MRVYYEGEPLRLGKGPNLLLDDSLIEDRWKLSRVLHRPTKFIKNPIVYRDKPWEGDLVYSPWVIWDEDFGLFRMWYQCFSLSNYYSNRGPIYWICYAESEDGVHWMKPLMEICEFPGYSQTNIVYSGTLKNRAQGVQVIRNPDQSDKNKKYMMVVLEAGAIRLAYSPDGLSWTLSEQGSILDYHSDCKNHLVYDESNGKWLLYCRPIYMVAAYNSSQKTDKWDLRHRKRRVAVMSSKDLLHWSYPRTVMYPDERDSPDYDSCTVFRYGSHFIMLYADMDGDGDMPNDIKLASSTDGFHWHRFHSREPYLARGNQGGWEGGQVLGACPPVKVGEDLYIYYSGTVNPQGMHAEGSMGGIGLSIIKSDRYVEQRAGEEPGYLLTKEFILEGKQLSVNVATNGIPYKEKGMLVEIVAHPSLGEHSKSVQAIDGFTFDDCDLIKGTGTEMMVTWNGNSDLSPLLCKPIYLRFKLQNMGLYSFQIQS